MTLILLIISPLLLAVIFLVILVADTALENKSPLFPYKGMQRYNHLYKHSNCGRLFRFYQLDLYNARHGKDCCPHCEREIRTYRSKLYPSNDSIYESPKVDSQSGWMNYHTDCPKLDLMGKIRMANTLKLMKKVTLEEESVREFEKYNKIKVDLKWIENLSNSKSKL